MNKVLMYHSIGNNSYKETGTGLYCVPTDKFREQMEFVKHGTAPVITFDDGLVDNYTNALPILKEFGLVAYFFILAGKVGDAGYLNWEQIKELRNHGMSIGSHGVTHRILIGLNDKEIEYELRQSKKILEDNLGINIDYFSIPRGFYNSLVLKKVKETGYKQVFTSNYKDNDGFRIGRIAVRGNWSLEYFAKVVNNGLSFKDKTEELIKNSAKMILGVKNYDRIRTRILS